MDEQKWLVDRFEAQRTRLRAVAYRMLGSESEAEDAVQEAWLRVSRAGADGVENLGGWLTTVVARVCLDALRTRKARPEVALEGPEREASEEAPHVESPEEALLLADSMGPALMLVLDMLAPAERVAFVLHDLFGVSFEEIAAIVGRSSDATRQLASRARRRLQGGDSAPGADTTKRRDLVQAFLTASREGDFEALLHVLAPDAELRADELAIRTAAANAKAGGAPTLIPTLRGANNVARALSGRARGARPVLIDGAPGGAWAPRGQVKAAFLFTVEAGKIAAIDILMEPARLASLNIVFLEEPKVD